ncbi:MAG: glycosyltransferase family 2 protein [Planctomycetota bacterium]
MTRFSALFVNYNSWRHCVDALLSLRENPPLSVYGTPMDLEVVVVDNCSPQRDPDAEADLENLLADMKGRLVRHHENGGYAKGMNLALEHATGDWILVSNPDVLFLPDCLSLLLRHLQAFPGTGAAAPEGYWDTTLEGRLPPNILPTIGDLWALTMASVSPRFTRRYSERRTRQALPVWEAKGDVELRMLSGCCFLLRRSTIDEIGFFDESFPLYYEDTDLSMRMRKHGLKIVQVAGAKLVHFYNRSGQTDMEETMSRYWISRRRYYHKWYGWPGRLAYGLSRWLLNTSWAKKRAARSPHRAIHDLGSGVDKPVIRLERPRGRFLVELALDPNFYLAAGMFGSGDTWTPGDELFKNFGESSYFFRLVDLTRGKRQQIGIYKYEMTGAGSKETAEESQESQESEESEEPQEPQVEHG